MSQEGQLARGLKWWKNNRDLDGVLLPVIANDADKMIDVKYYLEYTKGWNKDDVDLVLHQLFLLRRAEGGIKSVLFQDLRKKLVDKDFKPYVIVKETKSEGKK